MDFDVESEWHFFATSQGKSACDQIGGVVKDMTAKLAYKNPLQIKYLLFRTCIYFAKKILEKKIFSFILLVKK